MKYYLRFNKDQTSRAMVYCDKDGHETSEDIIRSLTSEKFIGKFVAAHHTPATEIIEDGDDENMFILQDIYGYNHVWEVHGKMYDSVGTLIPHLYRVIKIAIMFD